MTPMHRSNESQFMRQNMRRFFLTLIAVSCCLAGAAHALAQKTEADAPIGMVTGPKIGTYIAFGRDIAQLMTKFGGPLINVYESSGSIDNIKRITSKEHVGLAIVQSDVLGFLSRSRNEESIAIADKLRLVAPFYNEEVHILARANIHRLADLNGKRVVVGMEGSGSMITAVNIFSILHIAPGKSYKIDPPRGVVAVLNDEVDAVIFVGGKPVKMFKNMEELAGITTGRNAGKLKEVHFIPLDDARLLQEYKPALLTHQDYSFIDADVPTIAVTAVLITYDYSRRAQGYYRQQCRNLGRMVSLMGEHMSDLKATGHPKWKEVDLAANVGNWRQDSCSAEAFNQPQEDNSALERDLLSVVRGKSQ
jgi:TRAP transporter TAXI family solute receptor